MLNIKECCKAKLNQVNLSLTLRCAFGFWGAKLPSPRWLAVFDTPQGSHGQA